MKRLSDEQILDWLEPIRNMYPDLEHELILGGKYVAQAQLDKTMQDVMDCIEEIKRPRLPKGEDPTLYSWGEGVEAAFRTIKAAIFPSDVQSLKDKGKICPDALRKKTYKHKSPRGLPKDWRSRILK